MTSDRQIRANRQNARRSTGPRSPEGKAVAAENARKYGFTRSPEEVVGGPEALRHEARELLGGLDPTEERLALAEFIVAAGHRLRQAKSERLAFLEEAVDDWEVYRVPGHYEDWPVPIPDGHFGDEIDRVRSMPVWIKTRYERPKSNDEQMALVLAKKSRELARYDRHIAEYRAARRRALKALYRSLDP